MAAGSRHSRIAIIGTGFAGLGMAIKLKEDGVDDFVLLERASDVGGVWRDNQYPGCACDVQSHLYSYSFALNPGWSRAYSPAPEIWQYLRDCAERYQLRGHIRFEHEVKDAAWDEHRQLWRLETSQGALTAELLISAVGGLSNPSFPAIPGLGRFQGKVMHSAQWDPSYPLEGKRVAVIGTGASAIQIVPAIQPKVASVHLFQRTPPWVLPRRDHPIAEWKRSLYRRVPVLQRLLRGTIYGLRELTALGFMHPGLNAQAERLALRYLRRTIKDPALRRKLTPSYTLGCKRVLISDDYLPSLNAPNVELLTTALAEVRERSVVGASGEEREVDAIVFATGFHVADMPLARHVRGRAGRSLDEVWQGSPRAHLGVGVAGFPNFFMLLGPNTGLGHTSVVVMIESQLEHVRRALRFLDVRGLASLEPSAEAQAAYNREIDEKLEGTVWNQGGCKSWYLDATGRNSTLWPGFTFTFARRVEPFDPGEYVAIERRAPRLLPARPPEVVGAL